MTALPGPRTLYWNDRPFRRAAGLFGFGLFVAVGLWWFGRPMPNADPAIAPTPEFAWVVRWGPSVALGLASFGLLAAIWRFLAVRRVFTCGTAVVGTVIDLETAAWETTANRNQSHGINKTTNRTYHATVRYALGGDEHTVRLRLPHAAGHYGMARGGPVDLMVLPSAPERPLIRAVYLERVKVKWFF